VSTQEWHRTVAGYCIAVVVATATGCGRGSNLEQLTEARRLSSELLVDFTKTADAANRAVMADTDADSIAFARESAAAAQEAHRVSTQLGTIVAGLGYSEEVQRLAEFNSRFSEYQTLDRTILGLAVENTNLKAQRLSFGSVQKEADAFRGSLEAVSASSSGETWHVKALAAEAVSAVREIQVLQAPHIAEADDAAMGRIEKQMASVEGEARSALEMLGRVQPSSKTQIAAATSALNRLMDLNAQLIVLSRRNSNVRSLALSLGKKRMVTAGCEESLRALQDGLAKRGFPGSR
jgi:hypothetical protein